MGRPLRLLAPLPAPPPHPPRGADGRRQAPHRGVDWWGRVWDNDPAQQPPPPTLGLRRHGWTWPTRCMVSSPWSLTCGGQPCRSRGRSMPRPGGPTSSAVLTRVLTTILARGLPGSSPPRWEWEQGRSSRARVHAPPPAACRRRACTSPYAAPSTHRHRPLDHGAAGPGSEINLHPCFAAPVAPPLAPSNHWRLSTWVGWVLPPSSPPPLGQPELHSPPHPGGTPPGSPPPPLLLLLCGDVEPHPGPMRVAEADVTSLRLHWHTVPEWRADVVLIQSSQGNGIRILMEAVLGDGWTTTFKTHPGSRATPHSQRMSLGVLYKKTTPAPRPASWR